MLKRGQLGIIEFKYFMGGFFFGLIGSFILVLLGNKDIIPFKIPVVCGSVFFSNKFGKKGQLGVIEFKFFMMGLLGGLVGGLALVWLGTSGVLPFEIPLVCAQVAAK
jgi:hypothetical protein